MRTEEEAVSRLRALAPSAGRLTQRISQKIAFSVHQGSGGWGPSLLATGLVSRPLPHRSLSASNVKMQRKEVALIWDSAWSPPSGTWDGKKWEPGERHQALLSHLFSGQCHLRAMFGAGHGKAGAVGREMQTLPGKPGSPLNGAWRLGGLGATHIILCARHPRVRSCVVSKCELPHSTIGGKRWGEAMQGRGVRGRDDLLSQQTLSELQETKPQFETKIFIKHPECEKNIVILFLQE